MKASLVLLMLLATSGLRAALVLDSSFDTPTLERPGSVTLAATAPDGKVFIAGEFDSVSGQPRLRLARALADGRLDPTFDAGQADYVTAMLPLSDGRLLAASRIRTSDGQLRTGVLRLETNGAVDLTFSGALPAGLTAYVLALAPDGKVIAGGAGGPRVARLMPDGSPDSSFQVGAAFDGNGFGGNVNALAVQPDGKVFAGGYFYYYDGSLYWPKLVRLHTNGTLDRSFDTPLAFWWDDFVDGLALRPDGKLWVAGRLEQVTLWPNPEDISGYRTRCVALLRPDGTLDGSFTNLFGLHNFIRSLAVLDDGRPVVQGEFFTINDVYRPSIARLNTNGTLDATFNPPMAGSPVAAYPGGRALLCGVFHRGDGWSTSLARLNANGTVDDTFRVVTGLPAEISAVARQPDGKLVVAGNFELVDSAPIRRLLRLNPDGSRDTNFNAGSGPEGGVSGLAVLTNGQILVAGSFASFNGQPCTSLCRLHADGRFDDSYVLTFGGVGLWNTWPSFNTIAQTGEGKIVLTGIFSGPRFNLMRLNADASLDESFVPAWSFPEGFPPHYWPSSLLPLPDGSTLVGGSFSDCGIADEPCSSGQNFGAMVRFDSSGTPDLRFDPLALRIYALEPLAAQPDGKVLAIHGEDWGNYLQRLLPDGSFDPLFHPGVTSGGSVSAGLAQSNGLIVVAGSFTEFNGMPRQRLARLQPNGALDSCFNPGPSVDGAIHGISVQPDSQWLLFGAFSSVNNARRSGIALVRWEDFCLRPFAEPNGAGTPMAFVVMGPTNRLVCLESSTDLSTWIPVATNTLPADGWRVSPSNGVFASAFYRAVLLP